MRLNCLIMEMKMSKMKTNSSLKNGRVKLTGRKKKNGGPKVLGNPACRVHKTSNRPRRMVRQTRDHFEMFKTDGDNVLKNSLPYRDVLR